MIHEKYNQKDIVQKNFFWNSYDIKSIKIKIIKNDNW